MININSLINKHVLFCLLLVTTFLNQCSPPGNQSGGPKPNILWVTIEDTSPQFIGCYGNHQASTPVIDRLASEGVRFTNVFST
jgi:sugar/nucleoside kinase (ribokinase family)